MQAHIASIDTFVVTYPVQGHFKFFLSRDGRPAGRETVVVRITDSEGRRGFGQSVPSHTWSYETLESVQSTIDRYLAPALVGLDAFDSPAINAALSATIAPAFSTGQPICKAGIDLALFDLTGRISGQSVAERFGRTVRDAITLSWTLNPQTLDEVGPLVAAGRARGFTNFNVKVGAGYEFDVAMCGEIRRHAPDAFVWVDANGGYDLETALRTAPRFAELGIAALEQPLAANRLGGYAQLKKQGALPILMDESIITAVDLREFHQLGLLDGVAMKVARCGGLSEARAILDYLEEHELLFFASGLTDPDLALSACLILFGAYDLARPAALNATQFLQGSILADPIQIDGDQARVPTGPGLGVEVDEEKLERGLGIENSP